MKEPIICYTEKDLKLDAYFRGELSARDCGLSLDYGIPVDKSDGHIIKLRPHHFRTFFGENYGLLKVKRLEQENPQLNAERAVIDSLKRSSFYIAEKVHEELCSRLWHSPEELVMIVPGPKDVICDRCDFNYKQNKGCVTKENWDGWLGLELGVPYTVGEILRRLEKAGGAK